MAAYDYNELSYGLSSSPDKNSVEWNTMDPLYRWDTHYPEKYSHLTMNPDYPGSPRRLRSRHGARYKTQPITFDEIKEVDEEAPDESKDTLKSQFQEFSRSMDGLMLDQKLDLSRTALSMAHEFSRARRRRSRKLKDRKTIHEVPETPEKLNE